MEILYITYVRNFVFNIHGLLELTMIVIIIVGDNYVSLGSSYVFVRVPCQSKSSLSH